jgi:phosphoglycerate kinase
MKKTIRDVDVSNKRVLVRVDFNVPLKNGKVTNDNRIRAALPTIRYLLDQNARVILCSHLGRPKGEVVEELRLDPVANRLSELLEMKVNKAGDCIGPEAEEAVEQLQAGQVLLLENTRFHPGEKKNDIDFAEKLAKLADLFVNDAFGAVHRAHASTEGVAHRLPAVAGLLMAEELETLSRLLEAPEKPFIAVLGGAKVSDKIGVIQHLLAQVDGLLIGGGMANTFLKAKNLEVGRSLVEEGSLEEAKQILDMAEDRLVLPLDAVVAKELAEDATPKTVSINEVPQDEKILDIGPQTVDLFKKKMGSAKTVVWNGPLGVFETSPFAEGTMAIARLLPELDAATIVGGGDTVPAIQQVGVEEKITHISTGGGAFLDFLQGKELPGVAALEDK